MCADIKNKVFSNVIYCSLLVTIKNDFVYNVLSHRVLLGTLEMFVT